MIELRAVPAGEQISSPTINKSVQDKNIGLINTLTSYCEAQYKSYGKCQHCTHPSGKCSGSCRTCADQINFHKDGRTEYNCQKYIYYYVCRYSWKYCSEIMYALEQFDISNYPAYNILSVGCGGAPDLMAFEEIMSAGDPKELFYTGYDINPYWTPVHNIINQYTDAKEHFGSEFKIQDIFEAIDEGKLPERHYNVLVFEYFLSHFMEQNMKRICEKLFDGLLLNILANRLDDSPFLFIINDIYHYKVTDYFNSFLKKFQEAGYYVRYRRRHFGARKADFDDGSIQYPARTSKLKIPYTIDNPFDRAVFCTSAQLIVEVEKK